MWLFTSNPKLATHPGTCQTWDGRRTMGGASSSLTESSPLNTGRKGKIPATVFDDPLEGLRQALTRAKQAKAQPQRRRVRQHFWLSAHDEVEWAEEYYGATSVPVRFLHWINSHTVQMTLVALLVLDAIAEVSLALQSFFCRHYFFQSVWNFIICFVIRFIKWPNSCGRM